MISRSTSLLFLALALGAIVSGCGGGGDGGSSADANTISSSPISKPEFVEQANAICKPGRARLLGAVLAYQQKHLDEPSVKVVPNTARAVIEPVLQAQIDQIRHLGAPPGDASEIEHFFTSLLHGVDEIVAKKPPTFSEAERMLQPADAVARRYGIDQCKYELESEQFNTRVLSEK